MINNRIRGSLVAGAIGDALGNPVEFISHQSIISSYGPDGITRFDTHPRWTDAAGKAVFTDDTQMSLFTAEGLLIGHRDGRPALAAIREAYLEWYGTQTGRKSELHHAGTMRDVPALNVNRAPGNTCLQALGLLWRGMKPHNNSKGCGGVMRVAPIALWAAAGHMPADTAMRLAGEAAELTHQHPLGYIPAALLTEAVYRLAVDAHPTRGHLVDAIGHGVNMLRHLYPAHPSDVATMKNLADRAIELASNSDADIHNVTMLGEGWTGEEALAIALYSAVRHFDDLEAALVAAVNHNGDSDSTGAIAGNILGAAIGYDAIPPHYRDGIEQLDLLLSTADALAGDGE